MYGDNVTQNRLIDIAVKEALKSNHKQKIGCVIYKNNQIISKSHNVILRSFKKLHPRYRRWPGAAHAEVSAIIKAKKDLRGCDALVIRVKEDENGNHLLKMSKPCIHCMKYLIYVGIDNIYFSNESGIIEKI